VINCNQTPIARGLSTISVLRLPISL